MVRKTPVAGIKDRALVAQVVESTDKIAGFRERSRRRRCDAYTDEYKGI